MESRFIENGKFSSYSVFTHKDDFVLYFGPSRAMEPARDYPESSEGKAKQMEYLNMNGDMYRRTHSLKSLETSPPYTSKMIKLMYYHTMFIH